MTRVANLSCVSHCFGSAELVRCTGLAEAQRAAVANPPSCTTARYEGGTPNPTYFVS